MFFSCCQKRRHSPSSNSEVVFFLHMSSYLDRPSQSKENTVLVFRFLTLFWVATRTGLPAVMHKTMHQLVHTVHCCSTIFPLCLRRSVSTPVSLRTRSHSQSALIGWLGHAWAPVGSVMFTASSLLHFYRGYRHKLTKCDIQLCHKAIDYWQGVSGNSEATVLSVGERCSSWHWLWAF